jgi:4-aminobutyrate aminotransferase-like enzyme
LRGYFSTFGGNPVSCSIGLAVLRVLKNEKLKSSANNVGRFLSSLLANIKVKYSEKVGDIRGQGLIWAIEIVKDISKEADPAFARDIVDIMRTKEKILIGLTGIEHNILLLTPPLCFTVDNSRRYVIKKS